MSETEAPEPVEPDTGPDTEPEIDPIPDPTPDETTEESPEGNVSAMAGRVDPEAAEATTEE